MTIVKHPVSRSESAIVSRCINCGGIDICRRHGKQKFHFNDGDRIVPVIVNDVAWDECLSCGEIYYDHKARAIIERAQARAAKILAPTELHEIRRRIGVSHASMARLLGVGEKSYIRWETGISIQTRSIDNLIRLTTEKVLNKQSATVCADAPTIPEDISIRFPLLPTGATELYQRMMSRFPENCFPLAMVRMQEAH